MGANIGNYFTAIGLGLVNGFINKTTGLNAGYADENVAAFGNNAMATGGNTGYNMSSGSSNWGLNGSNYSQMGASSYGVPNCGVNNSLFGFGPSSYNSFQSTSWNAGNQFYSQGYSQQNPMLGRSVLDGSLANFAAYLGMIC